MAKKPMAKTNVDSEMARKTKDAHFPEGKPKLFDIHKNTSTPMIPRRRAEGNKKGVSAVSEEARKQKLQNAAEIIDQMSEKETEIAKLVAQSMQLGYDLAKAETQPA